MRILITGTGRSGTTLLREVVVGLDVARFYCGRYSKEEDWGFFKYKELPENYMTKIATPNPPNPTRDYNIENLIKYMEKYDDLYLLFSIRHPIDTCMSKIVRGQKHSDGGHKYWEEISVDGTVKGAILSVNSMRKIYDAIKNYYPQRVLAVRMESLILNSIKTIEEIAEFLHCKITKRSLVFYLYNSNPYQFRDYGTDLDQTHVNLHEKWQTAYNGYFKDKEQDIKMLKKAFKGWTI